VGKATAKPRDSSRENRIGPREKISSRTGQLAAPYLGACGGEIQNQTKRVHNSAQRPRRGDDVAVRGGDAAVGKMQPILETETRIDSELP
jgi:hypothetical protein